MDSQSNLLQLEKLFSTEIKDIRNHLSNVYENTNTNHDFVLSPVSLKDDKSSLNSNIPMTIKNEPLNMHEDIDAINHNRVNKNVNKSFDVNSDNSRNLLSPEFNATHTSNINVPSSSIPMFVYPNHDRNWNQTIQSTVNAPLNSADGQTQMLLMILKMHHDNHNSLTRVLKRLETIEQKCQLLSSPHTNSNINSKTNQNNNFLIFPPQNNHNQVDKDFQKLIYSVPEKTAPPSADRLFSPMENDYQFHQFELGLNDPNYRMSLIQVLRQNVGGNLRETVRRMIFALITRDFSLKFNRTGANNKYAFKAKLEPLIKEAILGFYTCPETDVEVAIVRTLKETKDRMSSKKKCDV